VYFRVFRGKKFKDTKGTNAYNQSSWFYKIKKNFSCTFVYFVVQNLKTRKSRKSISNQAGSIKLKKLFVNFRVFRGKKFKDTKVTKVYKQSSWFCKNKKNFSCIFVVKNLKTRKSRKSISNQAGSIKLKKLFVNFRVFRGSKFKGTKAKPKVLVAMSLSSSRIVFWATVYVLVYKDVWASGNGFTIATTM